ncbi:MAG: DNA-3-methyladenine glycosylase I, partial [Anaerolineales bacterium]
MSSNRCGWEISDPLYIQYHDTEWGVPVFDDKKLFEFLILEGFQAGLSWITILRKRESFRKAFANFDPESVAKFGETEINRLMQNNGIIRNRQKIEAAITNARAFLQIQEQYNSFSTYMWQFVNGKPIINTWHALSEIPAQTDLSIKVS